MAATTRHLPTFGLAADHFYSKLFGNFEFALRGFSAL